MHLKDDELRAWIDNQLSAEKRQSAEQHLSGCASCAQRYEAMQQSATYTENALKQLSPGADLRFSAHKSLERFAYHRKEKETMRNWFKRPVWIGAFIAAVMAVAMIFPPVRALASNFLGLFRVEQVRVVSIDTMVLSQFDEGMQAQQSAIRQFFNQNIEVQKSGDFTTVSSAQAAAELAGFQPRLPAQRTEVSLGVLPAQTYTVTIDAELWNAILETLDQEDASIPAELDGQQITIQFPAAITTGVGACQSVSDVETQQSPDELLDDCTVLVEMPSVTVQTPDGLDVIALMEAVLRVSGMSADEASAFAQNIDWATTLILPVPTGDGVVTQDVNVDQVQGTLITHADSDEYVMIWTKDGILYGMSGKGDPAQAIDLANTLTE